MRTGEFWQGRVAFDSWQSFTNQRRLSLGLHAAPQSRSCIYILSFVFLEPQGLWVS